MADKTATDHTCIVRLMPTGRYVAACSCGWQDNITTIYPALVMGDWEIRHIEKLGAWSSAMATQWG